VGSDTVTQENGNEVLLDLFQELGCEILLGEVCATARRDFPTASGCPGLFERGLDAASYEGVRGSSSLTVTSPLDNLFV
jgi:hypothetical protein